MAGKKNGAKVGHLGRALGERERERERETLGETLGQTTPFGNILTLSTVRHEFLRNHFQNDNH